MEYHHPNKGAFSFFFYKDRESTQNLPRNLTSQIIKNDSIKSSNGHCYEKCKDVLYL